MNSSAHNAAPATEFGRMIRLMGAPQRVVVFLMLPAMFLGGVQFVAQGLTLAVMGNRNFERLGIFSYLGQWVQLRPATNYGQENANLLHWSIAVFLLLLVGAVFSLILWAHMKRVNNPQLKPGLATDKDVRQQLGTKQLVVERGAKLRPSLANTDIQPEQVGYLIGAFKKMQVWLRIEDPTIIVGPSRSGKGFRLLLGWLMSAPGAVITTSVKMDNAKLTMKARERMGSPTLVWAPGIEGGKDVGTILKWDPVAGCLREETLVRRINALVPAGAFGGSTSNGGHWDALGRQLASHLFHAAACGDRTVDTIWDWVSSPKKAEEAVRLIREHPEGMNEHANHLEYVLGLPHEQRATSWGVLPTVLAFMESRAAREWMKPGKGETVDLAEFIVRRGTLYVVGDKQAAPIYVRMIDGLMAELDFITRSLAAASPSSRLDPPVTYLLDELGNLEYQGFYQLITAGGGEGRVGVGVFQSKSQLDQFGEGSTGATLWDAAVAKIVLPGGGDPKALGEMQDLIGEAWYGRESHTVGSGEPSAQYSDEERAIFKKGEIRTLENKYAFVFYRNLRCVIAETIPFSDNPRFAECMADAEAIDVAFRGNSEYRELLSSGRNVHA